MHYISNIANLKWTFQISSTGAIFDVICIQLGSKQIYFQGSAERRDHQIQVNLKNCFLKHLLFSFRSFLFPKIGCRHTFKRFFKYGQYMMLTILLFFFKEFFYRILEFNEVQILLRTRQVYLVKQYIFKYHLNIFWIFCQFQILKRMFFAWIVWSAFSLRLYNNL